MHKRTLAILLIVILVSLSLLACDTTPESESNSNALTGTEPNDNDADPGSLKALSNAIAALPSKDALDTLWQTLDGYWNGKDHPIFFGFIYEDGQHALTYGQWNSEWQELGPVIGSRKTDQYVAELTVNLPAVEENAFSDGRPATEVTVTIDFNSFRSDGEVRINANDHWSTCIWRGTAGESHKNANPY